MVFVAVSCPGFFSLPVLAQIDEPVFTEHQQIAEAALTEGVVIVRTTTDKVEVADLLERFRSLYPGVMIQYFKMNSTELYNEFLSEAASGVGTADILWSSSMDLQIKLVNDGYAMRYVSPEASSLPPWAVWRNEAYGVTAEPVAFVYNRRRLPETRVPRTHESLLSALVTNPNAWQGRVAAYDPERSGTGFLFLTQDVQVTPRTWELVRSMGQVGVKLYTSTATMLDQVASGDVLLAYNILGSYALERAKIDSQIGVVLPSDYMLVLSRIAFIPRTARHPNAARLFLDYLLSKDGQLQLAARSLPPVRTDTGSTIGFAGSSAAPRPIQVSPELLTYLDQSKRASFLKQWRRIIQGR